VAMLSVVKLLMRLRITSCSSFDMPT